MATILPLGGGEVRAAEGVAAFGDLVVRYDPEVWDLTPGPNGFLARCRHRDCGERFVRGEVLAGGGCDVVRPVPEEARGGEDRQPPERLESGGLSWVVRRWFFGCRNAHPRSVSACTDVGDRAHRIVAPLVSCRTAPLYGSEARIMTLIRGIGPR